MAKIKKIFNKRTTVISTTIIALLAIWGAKKTYDYAAPPSGPKDCNFIYPESQDQTKPTTISVKPNSPQINFEQQGGVINDASCLNRTSVYGIVKVTTADDIKNALQFARDNNLKVTPAGQHH